MNQQFVFHQPSVGDGWEVSQLISACPPLDTNSVYCNLLQCHHFASTSVAVRKNGELVGFISAYRIPDKPETLFVWQVAVAESARGHGLATQMIEHILKRQAGQTVRFIETTITQDNEASWALFGRVAKHYGAPLIREDLFIKEQHFAGQHDTELLVTIGPLE
ncbi:MAG: diaminobutyrate acetyltransferase [Pseudomonadales bacterium]|nr:diaminobutyrate acetyltransferase [Pseudomonadales bacterium]